VLALHWDFATLQSPENIEKWLADTADLKKRNVSDFKLEKGTAMQMELIPGEPCEFSIRGEN